MKIKSFFYVALLATLVLTSCGGAKKLPKATGAKEIEIPLSGREYQTNKDYYRARSSGKSIDLTTAKKIGLQNCKTEVAGNIQTTIKTVTDQYINQRQVQNQQEYESKFEEMSRNVVNQKLVDVVIIGEKIYQEQDGSYTYWVAIEVAKEAILNGINEGISKDKKLQLDYDKYKYEQIFNQEMQKFEQQ